MNLGSIIQSVFSPARREGDAQPYAKSSLTHHAYTTSGRMWRSRLSWRIALSAFFTILVIQVAILVLTVKQEEQKIINDIREVGRSAIVSVITNGDMYKSPISDDRAARLLSSTLITGFSIYDRSWDAKGNHYQIKSFGDPLTLFKLNREDVLESVSLLQNDIYETIYQPSELNNQFYVVARLDAHAVSIGLNKYVSESILVMVLLSLLVTTVLMISLGYKLLEPVLFMRNNLMMAQQNPDNPNIPVSPFNPNDELGEAILIAQKLIHQNAENMQQIRSAAEDKIHKLAYFDQLTGLPNRTLFVQKLTEMAYANDDDDVTTIAVVTLDIDHFKDINDSMGHNVGDAILRGVAKRLRSSLPDSAVVSRAGEDEFAVTMPLNTDMNLARDVGQKVANIIREKPFKVFNETFQIRSSIGVATYPDDGTDPNEVLKHADIALNRAKEEGRDRLREYSQDFDRVVQQRFQLLRDLRDAMEHEDLDIFYQPQFDLNTGEIIGAEALLRWWKKDDSKEGGSYISPVDFIPIAEQSGLIVPIGAWVMKEACKTAKKWHEAGHDIRIAVNVSGAQFFQSDLVGYTKRVLKETGVAPHLLELEVTESVFMDDMSVAVETLKNLHELGIELAIDDFGTGYSSLSYLRQFNIDRLKIDQSFIRNALSNNDDAAIARTIIRLAHSLNLKVIAEGVETLEHQKFLKEEGCDEVQGFRYSKPVPQKDFWAFVEGYEGDLDKF